MHKCDSCGKVVVNEQDYMCPHCGAVTKKHCDHRSHLPDDKYNRTNAYNTNSNYNNPTPHKSKTYNYERVPKTNESQKFDINDLANIKNAEDAKRVAEKVFIERDANGRKKFKPLAIVLIIIFAVNIFGNLLGVVGDVLDSAFDGLEYVFEDTSDTDYTLGVDEITHHFSITPIIEGAVFDRENDCLTISVSELYFYFGGTFNEDGYIIEGEWRNKFTEPNEILGMSEVRVPVTVYTEKEIKSNGDVEKSYEYQVTLAAEFTESGELEVYGVNANIRNLQGENVYLKIDEASVLAENTETNEKFDSYITLPFNVIKILPDNSLEYYNMYFYDDTINSYDVDLSEQTPPGEYSDYISF